MPPKSKLHKEKGKLKSIPKPVVKSSQSSEQPRTSQVDNQAQFEVELLWCIQQLQIALSSGKLNPKQEQETSKTLNSLMSNSTPVIRKRQLMRLSFGDYRDKMAKEEAKYTRKNERIVYLPSKPNTKSVFVKKAPFLNSGKGFKFNFPVISETEKSNLENALESLQIEEQNSTENASTSQKDFKTNINIENGTKDIRNFHFLPSNNAFRFQFNVDME